jgi:hypothetical protein
MTDLAIEMRQSQLVSHYTIEGHRYQRVRVQVLCMGCMAIQGQLHITGCNSEPCPVCQILPVNTCGCLG